jgi:hypothetical protein
MIRQILSNNNEKCCSNFSPVAKRTHSKRKEARTQRIDKKSRAKLKTRSTTPGVGLKPREQTWEQQRPAGASETEGEDASSETSEQAKAYQSSKQRGALLLLPPCKAAATVPVPASPSQPLRSSSIARERRGEAAASERACSWRGAGRICRRAAAGARAARC